MKQSYKLKGISYKWLLWVFITYNSSFITHNCFAQTTVQITPEGNKLKQLHVENLWLPGHHVNWETGEPDKPEATKGNKTHCSAFVASVCKQLDIYMIHPPSKISLANAQYTWLFSEEGYSKGWRQIKETIFETVQRYANMGMVVVAVCKNPNPDKPGHIALVMPTEKTPEELTNEGLTVIQAGHINSSGVSLKQDFALHLTGWNPPPTEIVFFYHEEGKK